MTLPLFRSSRLAVDNLDTVVPGCCLENISGYAYLDGYYIERSKNNGVPYLLLGLDGRTEYYYPETTEVLALMEEMLFNWILETN